MISLPFYSLCYLSILSADPNITDVLRKEHPKFSRNRNRVWKIVDLRHISCRMSETVDQDRVQIAIDH